MQSDDQKRFLDTIKKALTRPQNPPLTSAQLTTDDDPTGTRQRLERIAGRTTADRLRLLARLEKAAEALQMSVQSFDDPAAAAQQLVTLIQRARPEWGRDKHVLAWRHPLIESLNLSPLLEAENIRLTHPTAEAQLEATQISDALIGITSADYCLADTATLAMRTRPDQSRSVSLLPTIHVALIGLDQLLLDLEELYTVIQHDKGQDIAGPGTCMSLITGPSKTADIEATMVFGAHGPREVHIYVLTDPPPTVKGG